MITHVGMFDQLDEHEKINKLKGEIKRLKL